MAELSVRGLMFTDIEGSTALIRRLGPNFEAVLKRHQEIVRAVVGLRGGVEQSREGDSMFVTFPSARAALEGAVEIQRHLESERWPADGRVRVRIGLHVGEVADTEAGLVGLAIHQAARVMSAAHGGQIVATGELLGHAERIPPGVSPRALGQYELRDIGSVPLYQLDHADLQGEFPPLRTRRAVADNLPAMLTSLVGRADEAARVRALLASHRLVTLLGAGGCGKTRLALRVAADELDRFVDGVWFVDLAALSPGTDVKPQVAQTLGVHGADDELVAAVRERELLIVIDNCEHVLESAAPLVALLLDSSPLVRIMAASRAPLNLAGEVRFHVPPLSAPSPEAGLDEIKAAESVQLFVERAGLVRAGFECTAETSAAIAAICARVDGIPLAIELAAARLAGMSLGELSRRLADRFDVLAGGARSAPERHWTMHNTVDWTFRLLDSDGQRVVSQLAVFRGGCDLEAIEATCARLLPVGRSVLDAVIELVDRSLLSRVEQHDSTRFTLHEPVRDYLLESVGAHDREQHERRHADWFACLAARLRDGPEPGGDVAWIHRHDDERENFRAAAEWFAGRDPVAALRLAIDVEGGSQFTMRMGWLLDLIRRLLPIAHAAPATLRATTTAILARDSKERGRLDESLSLCERSRELLGDSDDPIARCTVMGCVAEFQADAAGAVLDQRIVADAVAASDRVGGTYWPIMTRFSLSGRTAFSAGKPLLTESLHLAERQRLAFFADALVRSTLAVGTQFRADSDAVLHTWRQLIPRLDDRGVHWDNNACYYTLAEGEHADVIVGLHLAEHLLAQLRAHRFDPSFEASLRWVVAHLSRLQGDTDRAARNLELADRLATPGFEFLGGLADITRSALGRMTDRPAVTVNALAKQATHYPHAGITDIASRIIEELAAVAFAMGRHRDSADLLATATADRHRHGTPLSPAYRVEIDQLRAHLTGQQATVLDPASIHDLAAALVRAAG